MEQQTMTDGPMHGPMDGPVDAPMDGLMAATTSGAIFTFDIGHFKMFPCISIRGCIHPCVRPYVPPLAIKKNSQKQQLSLRKPLRSCVGHLIAGLGMFLHSFAHTMGKPMTPVTPLTLQFESLLKTSTYGSILICLSRLESLVNRCR